MARRGQLDVDPELVLDRRQGAEDFVLLRIELDVDVDRRWPPTEQHSRAAADQVAGALSGRRRAKRLHESTDARGIRQLTHAGDWLFWPLARS